ncbi:MAG: response regulator [candidate division Zixibacteria bacterium]|nr:response regulator [candidate division Zixibacteria bacterium]
MAKILIVDDSEVIRNLLTDFLADLGHTVDCAIDGQEGIDKALSNEYAVVICDVHMPKKNGFLVFTEISAKKPETEFVMTDSLPGDLAAQAQAAGVQHLLAKPFDLDQLQDTLERVLRPVQES